MNLKKTEEFIGNRNMIKWHMEHTKIPIDVIERVTGYTKSQIDSWSSDNTTKIYMDDIIKLSNVLLVASITFFLEDDSIPRFFENRTKQNHNQLLTTGNYVIIDVDTLKNIKYCADKGLTSDGDKELALYHIIRHLEDFDEFI